MSKFVRIYLIEEAPELNEKYGNRFQGETVVINALKYFMDFAIREYFLSIPNVKDIDYFAVAMEEVIDPDYCADSAGVTNISMKLGFNPTRAWCNVIYNHCMEVLCRYFDRWEMISYRMMGNTLNVLSAGDFRIIQYTRLFGVGRFEAREFSKPEKNNVTDPFYVAETITPDIDQAVYDCVSDTVINPVEITHFSSHYPDNGERVFIVSPDEVLDDLIVREPFEYSKIDAETERELERLKATNKPMTKDDQNKHDNNMLRSRKLLRDFKPVIRETWCGDEGSLRNRIRVLRELDRV